MADALGHAAVDLPGQEQRVERDAEIIDHDIGDDLRGAGVGIDLDLGKMRAVGERRGFGHESIIGRQFLLRARAAGEIGERDGAVGTDDPYDAVGDFEIARRGFEHVGGNRLEIVGKFLGGAR